VDSLVAGTWQGTGVARGKVGAVEVGGIGGIVIRWIGFRPCGAESSKGENSGLKLNMVIRIQLEI
jgi:hypothetical protein